MLGAIDNRNVNNSLIDSLLADHLAGSIVLKRILAHARTLNAPKERLILFVAPATARPSRWLPDFVLKAKKMEEIERKLRELEALELFKYAFWASIIIDVVLLLVIWGSVALGCSASSSPTAISGSQISDPIKQPSTLHIGDAPQR